MENPSACHFIQTCSATMTPPKLEADEWSREREPIEHSTYLHTTIISGCLLHEKARRCTKRPFVRNSQCDFWKTILSLSPPTLRSTSSPKLTPCQDLIPFNSACGTSGLWITSSHRSTFPKRSSRDRFTAPFQVFSALGSPLMF